ncbi:conserved hypothetical protein [Erwinia pyrifoliae Ep1/96]|nr:conserved hypothetical protein [Erwinia pyrifoliae Ep1/96]
MLRPDRMEGVRTCAIGNRRGGRRCQRPWLTSRLIYSPPERRFNELCIVILYPLYLFTMCLPLINKHKIGQKANSNAN